MVAAKPDCTKQRFGRLVVLGKAEIAPDRSGRRRRLWELRCDCGKIIKIPRDAFDSKKPKQISCGCAKRERWLQMRHASAIDITKQRFGSLVAIAPTGTQYLKRPLWTLRCDCGAIVFSTVSILKDGRRKSCGDKSKHPEHGLHYPPAPTPYPAEAGAIAAKYLHLAIARPHWQSVDQATEDYRIERLLRSAWILVYRRSLGEQFDDRKERQYIAKSLRFCQRTIDRRRRSGGLSYNRKQSIVGAIGSKMTDSTSFEAVAKAETHPGSLLSTPTIDRTSPKKHRFRRC